MERHPSHTVTGATGYTGRYIARLLLVLQSHMTAQRVGRY